LDGSNSYVITFEQWNTLLQNKGSYVDGIKETIIKKYNLQNPEILKRMNLSQNAPEQNLTTLKLALMDLDPTLKESQAHKAAQELLAGSETITVDQIIKNLGCFSCNLFIKNSSSHITLIIDDLKKESDWYQNRLLFLKRKVKDVAILRKYFEVIIIPLNSPLS